MVIYIIIEFLGYEWKNFGWGKWASSNQFCKKPVAASFRMDFTDFTHATNLSSSGKFLKIDSQNRLITKNKWIFFRRLKQILLIKVDVTIRSSVRLFLKEGFKPVDSSRSCFPNPKFSLWLFFHTGNLIENALFQKF